MRPSLLPILLPKWTPNKLFAAGEKGYLYDFTDPATMVTTEGGSTQVAALADEIGQINDLSPNRVNASINSGIRPLWWSRNGIKFAHFIGTTCRLVVPAVDLTGTTKFTVVVGMRVAADIGSGYAFSFATGSSDPGALWLNHGGSGELQSLTFLARGATDWRSFVVPSPSPSRRVISCVVDFTAAAAADRIKVRMGGVVPSGASSGSGATSTAGNHPTGLGGDAGGGANVKMDLYRVLLIGRELTASEIAKAEAWASAPIPVAPSIRAIVLGDSTITSGPGLFPVPYWVDRIDPNVLATTAETIAQQHTRWTNINPAGYQAVIVQVGLNDRDPAEAASVAIARLQSLMDDIVAEKDAGTKVIISTLTPCRAFLMSLYGAVDGPIAYQKWLDMNQAITGGGSTPITGANAVASQHTTSLNDGSGNLAAAYDVGDALHENNAGRQIIAAAWDAALVSVGL